ncbi:IPT/TIG domain-containing protein [Streptomyces sp. NPDC052040]|uniref:IPT/TIG domain-containing protein n=1 Tax=Streptomyces sp. NPDC052040 TaxID=3365682 RepID=UPI0037D6FED3
MTPAQAAGSITPGVTTRGGTFTGGSYTFVSPPTATGFSPITGIPAGGILVNITGTSLSTTTSVTFGTTAAAFAVLSATNVAAVAPTTPWAPYPSHSPPPAGAPPPRAPSSTSSDVETADGRYSRAWVCRLSRRTVIVRSHQSWLPCSKARPRRHVK